jgi:hypothetical protein
MCSASLIGKSLLVTAAHCVWDWDTKKNATDLVFVVGIFHSFWCDAEQPFRHSSPPCLTSQQLNSALNDPPWPLYAAGCS